MALPDPTRVSGPFGQRLDFPTPDGTGQLTHPSVVYVEGGWNGFPYWGLATPYADGDDLHEDPCVYASADGIVWVVPSAAGFPLDDQPGSPGAYNSDVDLIMGPADTLYAVWRTFDPAATGAEEKLYFSSSVDGVTWSAKTQFYTSNMATRRLLSPALLYEAGVWTMWAVDIVPSPNQVVRLTGGAALTDAWGAPAAVDVGPMLPGKEPWHIDVNRTADGWIGLLADCTLNVSGTNGDLLFIVSTDGLTWANSGRSVIPKIQHDEHDYLYRATMIPDNIGSITGWRVWYSAWRIGDQPIWHIYRTWLTAGQTGVPPVTVADVTDLVSGSFRALVEARVCETFQTGDDPEGTVIAVSGGDVAYDATADVWSTMSMTTPGVSEHDGSSMFPRFADSLLAPYGNEIFIRWGIDAGASTLWVPMGYYRIDDTEQAHSSSGLIRTGGPDRMQGLIDARLTQPRQYSRFDTIAAVVFDLVFDVYPQALVLWDDDDEQLPLGRDLVIEEDRYAALRDIATSRGKVVYFDSEGVLRFETAPDPDDIVWDIHAGAGGVLVSSSRSVSREGMYNAVVARGQGATESPAVGMAFDTGPNSPTRWGSRFGKVPRFYESPLLTTDGQARSAAAAILARTLGAPYSVKFDTVPNPALRPRQAVRIGQQDGNRERHIIDTLKVPLSIGSAMTGSTREQTLALIGNTPG